MKRWKIIDANNELQSKRIIYLLYLFIIFYYLF